METKNVIMQLRTQRGLTQDELATRLHVTRQAVSRWETGKTLPDQETLKGLSALFDVSINTLLGSPRTLICQCCGMPLEDTSISREPDGAFNEDYCKWCYVDGKYVYANMKELIDYLVGHMSTPDWPPEQARDFFENQLKKLAYWQSHESPEPV